MPFDNTDTYQQPTNTAAVTGQTISAQKHNILNKDHKDALTTRASKTVVLALTQTVTALSTAFETHVSGAFASLKTAFETHVSGAFASLKTAFETHVSGAFASLKTAFETHVSGAFASLKTAFETHVNINTANVHKAAQVSFTPQGGVSATTVQAAIVQAASMGGGGGSGGGGVALPIAISDVEGLQYALNIKAPVVHTHNEARETVNGFMSKFDKRKLDGGVLIRPWVPNTYYEGGDIIWFEGALYRKRGGGLVGAQFADNMLLWRPLKLAHTSISSSEMSMYVDTIYFQSTFINLENDVWFYIGGYEGLIGNQHILILKQDAVGGRTAGTYPSGFVGTFNLKMGANEVTVFSLIWDGSKHHITRLTQ